MREALAEFFGTAILITFGLGVVAQTVLSNNTAGSAIEIHLCWGLAVYASAGVSGAHLNPAVTLALAIRRGFPWPRVLPYVAAQVLGAFAGAALVYLTYREAFAVFDGGVRQIMGAQGTAGIFATYPAAHLSTFGGFVDQVVGTALLVAMVFALSDERNAPPPAGLTPVLVGIAVIAIGMAFGFNAGYAINPARDFGRQRLLVGAHRGPVPRRRARRHGLRPLHPRPPPGSHQPHRRPDPARGTVTALPTPDSRLP
jgi:MIP family channel proteins